MSDNWENGSYSIKALTGHKDFIRCVRFDKTHRAVSSGVDRMVCVWDLKTGECIKTMKGHTGGMFCSPHLVVCSVSCLACYVSCAAHNNGLLCFRGGQRGLSR
jgi:WD40 repeat protein